MIDLTLLRGLESKKFVDLIRQKDPGYNIDELLRVDKALREAKSRAEGLRAEKNHLTKAKEDVATNRERVIELNQQLKTVDAELEHLETELEKIAYACPNITQPDLPLGGKEQNKVVRTWGSKPQFDFVAKHHLELNEKLGWFDFKAGAKISGSQQLVYRGDSLKMLYALTRLMLKHNAANGHEPIFPPYIINEKTMINNGSLPKFKGDFYELTDDGTCLLPTAEVTFTGMFSDQIFKAEELPLRNCAWTSCFRREAGGYGAVERGLIRIHQFEKVELYTVCTPENSNAELERMVNIAEGILQMLGLHYRVSLLAMQDCSFTSAKTFDIEVWMPGQNAYYEVSSCSNCTDFQARRAKIRYRDYTGKVQLCHTLNASSLALPRLMIAIMEPCQQADGSLKLPRILQDEMNSLW